MKNLLREGLRKLTQAPPRHASGDRQAVVFAVAAHKGGVGKTTTSIHLASALARFHNQRVLLLDLDPQGHVHRALHRHIPDAGRPLSSVLEEERGADVLDAIVRTSIAGLDATPLDHGLAATEARIASRIGKETLLREAIRVARTWYDFIIIDCPPAISNLTLNALTAADRVLIPCEPSPLAAQGVDSLIETIASIASGLHPTIDIAGVLLTRVDGRNVSLNQQVVDGLTARYGDAVLPMRIGVSTAIPRAQDAGTDLFEAQPDARPAAHYRELAAWVLQQGVVSRP
jgi:chromosome partitioning protein